MNKLFLGLFLPFFLFGCSKKEENEYGNKQIQEQVKAWREEFRSSLARDEELYGIKNISLYGFDPRADQSNSLFQKLNDVNCELIKDTTSDSSPKSSGELLAITKALWAYNTFGCSSNNLIEIAQSLAVLESSRRRLVEQWDKEVSALPGTLQIEARNSEMGRLVLVGVNYYVTEEVACVTHQAIKAREGGRNYTVQHLFSNCSGIANKYPGIYMCPIANMVGAAHTIADKAGVKRDDNAWVGDATARYRLGWRGCSDNSLNDWRIFLNTIPNSLLNGRLKAVSSKNDTLMECQFNLFRLAFNKYGMHRKANIDSEAIRWCSGKLGLQKIGTKMAPPGIFDIKVLNDRGKNISWLYDPDKRIERKKEWTFTPCMTSVSQKLSSQGYNIPSPSTLRWFCEANGGTSAREFLSGESLNKRVIDIKI